MNKFCAKCGTPLDENGVCPNCINNNENKIPQPAPEPKPAEKPAPPTEKKQPAPVTPAPSGKEEPNSFALTITKACEFIGKFFTKSAVDSTLAQSEQKFPIWAVLLPVYALVEAFSRTISFRASDGSSLGLSRIFYEMGMNSVEVFFFALALALIVCFAYSIAVKTYLKILKLDTTFKEAANLTMAAYLPNAIVMLGNIVLFGNLLSGQSTISMFGMCGFVILLFLGISKMLGGKKPFWSFFLMLGCAAVFAAVLAMIVYSPVIVTRGLSTLSGIYNM